MCHAWHQAWGKITIVSAPETWNREDIYQRIPVSSVHTLDKCCAGKVQVALREYERELTYLGVLPVVSEKKGAER